MDIEQTLLTAPAQGTGDRGVSPDREGLAPPGRRAEPGDFGRCLPARRL
jgi:hypothetical protein